METVNPYVFIVGCPRSGTTLLQRIVDAHPRIAITPESHWIPRFRRGLTPEGVVTPTLIPRLLANAEFGSLGIDPVGLETLFRAGQPVSYAQFVTRIFDLYGKARGKALVGNKTPSFVRRLRLLHRLWPEAAVVHLVRDGRNVCLSMASWPKAQRKRPGVFVTWKDDAVSTAALWWELNVTLGRQAGNKLGPELYYEMRYESLVEHPAEECAALCNFLRLPYEDAMLRFHEGRTRLEPELDAKHAWLPITPGLRDWRSQMPVNQVERFEAAAGGLLDELGYPRVVPRPLPETLERASRIRNLLAQDSKWIQAVPRPQAENSDPHPESLTRGRRDPCAAVEVEGMELRHKYG